MTLVKLQDDLFIPEDFAENHYYFADAEGKKRYTGITTVLATLAKPQLIPWAARMAVEYISDLEHRHTNSLKEYQDIWGGDCPHGQMPELTIFRSKDFTKGLEEAKNAHRKKKEAAGEHGTDAHALVERWVKECITARKGAPVNDYTFDSDDPILKFKEWSLENVDYFLFAERPVHSK